MQGKKLKAKQSLPFAKAKRKNLRLTAKTQKTDARADKTAARGKGQVLMGRVVSVKSAKTATVLVSRQKSHPVYKKGFTQTKKYQADDSFKVAEGDLVEMVKVRPISKSKHWQISRVLGKDIAAIMSEQLKEEAEKAIAEVIPEASVSVPIKSGSESQPASSVKEEK